ncbi:MAG: sulfotransferase [Pirellulales bacterium]
MRYPNFFIVGAPKCGTTALAQYLSEHTAVFMSQPKEPHYFAADLPGLQDTTDDAEYRAMFAGVSEATRAVGEASVYYLYSRVAVANLHRYNPEARVVVMIRDPLAMLVSYHRQLCLVRDEDVPLAEALALEAERAQGRRMPRQCRAAALLQYRQVIRLGQQLRRLLDVVPREQVHVIVMDDFAADTRAEYRRVLAFLDLTDDGRSEFPVVNPARGMRSRALATFTEKTPRVLTRAALGVKHALGLGDLGVLERLRRLNATGADDAPLSPALCDRLRDELSDDVKQLSQIAERDLAALWWGEAGTP